MGKLTLLVHAWDLLHVHMWSCFYPSYELCTLLRRTNMEIRARVLTSLLLVELELRTWPVVALRFTSRVPQCCVCKIIFKKTFRLQIIFAAAETKTPNSELRQVRARILLTSNSDTIFNMP